MLQMILSQSAIRYFKSLSSKVTQGVATSASKTPYLVEGERIIQIYECIRTVWRTSSSVSKACQKYDVPRSSYYDSEQRFLKYGLAGLFPTLDEEKQNIDLEQLVVIAKKARPAISHTGILRITEAVPLTKNITSLDAIASILNSHGYGMSQLEGDASFFQRIQRTLKSLALMLQSPIEGRDSASRRDTFFVESDPYLNRLELLRELYYGRNASMKEVCRQFGIPLTTLYYLMNEYRLYGPWAVLPASYPGSKMSVSDETQLLILLEKLRHPSWSAQQIVENYELRCDRNVVLRIMTRWGLDNKTRPAVYLDRFVGEVDIPSESFKPIRTAASIVDEKALLESKRLNRHFGLICNKMKIHGYNLCDPGPLLIAPFVSELGILQAFETYGPPRLRGEDITNLALLNVMRIVAGYERIYHLHDNRDRSVALASGVGMFGSRSRFYDDTLEFKFSHLANLRNDVVARAKELGIIDGRMIAFDFHFKEFYGSHAAEKEIGKGPDKYGNLVPGFRPHVAWDLANNVILNIAYFQGGVRGPSIIRQFCEQNIFPIMDRSTVEEIYMDSEYTKEGDIHYFKEVACKNGDVYLCLKLNKQIKKLIEPALKEASGWIDVMDGDEKKGIDVTLPHMGTPLTIAILRNRETKENVRCFGSTNKGLTLDDILRKYRYRWNIENGLKDLIHSYFLDDMYGYDPEKVEFEFYCVMVARLAYESFLRALGTPYVTKEDGNKYTLASMRHLLFEKHNCFVELNSDDNICLTLLDAEGNDLEHKLVALYDNLSKQGRNKVLWWGNKGIVVKLKNQFDVSKVSIVVPPPMPKSVQ